MKKLMMVAPTCLVLAACGTAYVAPRSSSASDMSIHNAGSRPASVAVFEDAQECYKSHIAARFDPGESAKVSLPAQEPVALHFQQLGFTGGAGLEVGMCNIILTFKPKSGHRYSATMGNDSQGCEINITDDSVGSEAASVAMVMRQFTPPQGFTNKWCPALTEQQASQLQ